MSDNTLSKIIDTYKIDGKKDKYIEIFYNEISINVDENKKSKELIILINLNKILFLNNIIIKLNKNNKLDKFIKYLWKDVLFDITSLLNILDKLDNNNKDILLNIIFSLEDTNIEKFKLLWFIKKNYIGTIIEKSDTTLLDIIPTTSLDIENLKEINRSTIYKYTNKVSNLFYKYKSVTIIKWLIKLKNYITNDSTNEIFMFNLLNSLLTTFRKLYLLSNRNKIKYNENNLSINMENYINILIPILLKLIEEFYIKLKNKYKKELLSITRIDLDRSVIREKKKNIVKLSTYLFNPYFKNVFNFYIETLIKLQLDNQIKKRIINIISNVHNSNEFITNIQYNYIILHFNENIANNKFLENIDYINIIVDNYYYPTFKIKNKSLLRSVLIFYANKKIKDITNIYDNTFYIEFIKDLIKLNKMIHNDLKNEVNLIVNNVLEYLNESFQKIVIYIQKIKYYNILLKFKVYDKLSINSKTYQKLLYNDNIKMVNKLSLSIRIMLDLLIQISLYFNKNNLEYYTQKNIVNSFNYFLNMIIEKVPNIIKLKIKDNKYYEPILLIHKILFIYTNLNNEDIIEIMSNCNNFSVLKYQKIYNILTNDKIKDSYISFKFNNMINNIKLYLENKNEIKEIPDKYLDKITLEIMKNPVQLPSSKVILDLSTIQNILSNSNEDPYDRSYLNEDMLIPLNKLKEDINQFT